MRKILRNDLLRQLTITELIAQNEEKTIEQLSHQLRVSEKTIWKDIAGINIHIKPLKIKVRPTEACYLKWQNGFNLNYIYSCFLNASIEYQILEKILTEESLTYYKLADAVFVSVSTLRRSLVRMNETLQVYGMEILSNPVRLRGDERKIIGFLYAYLQSKYMVSDNFFNPFENQVIDEVLFEIFPKFNQRWSFTKSEIIKRVIKSHVIRLKNGNQLALKSTEKQPEEAKLLKLLAPYQLRLEKIVGVPFLAQIIGQIIEDKYAFGKKELKELEGEHVEVATKTTAIKNIISVVESEFGIAPSDNSDLMVSLYNRMVYSEHEIRLLNAPAEEFVNLLSKDRPALVKVLKEQYELNQRGLGKLDFSAFAFCLITEWPHLISTLTPKNKMSVGLFFSTSDSHLGFLKAELEKKLNRRVVITNLNTYTVAMLDQVEVDLIITDISGLSTKLANVCVPRYISEETLIHLITAYEHWLNGKAES